MKRIKKYRAAAAVLLLLAVFIAYKCCVLDPVWGVSPDESAAWKACSVPENAVKVEQPGSQAALVERSMFLVVPLIAAGCSFVIASKKKKIFDVSKTGVAAGAVLSFLLQPLHELLHGIVFPAGSTVRIGIITANFSGYAVSACPMTVTECTVYHLLPVFVFGVCSAAAVSCR